MSLVDVPPFFFPGVMQGLTNIPSFATAATLDAAGEYIALIFQAKEDMVISHVGWRTGTVAGSPTCDTRIETVGADGIPTGTLWAANTNIISGTLVSNTWTLHALTASATIARGDFFAVKIVYNSGTSLIMQRVTGIVGIYNSNIAYTVTNTTGSAVKAASSQNANIALGSSTTTFYSMPKSLPMTTVGTSTFNNTGDERRGLRFQVPFSGRCAGVAWFNSSSVGDANIVIYDDAGSVLASKALEGDQSANANTHTTTIIFDTPVTLSPSTWYRAALEPTSATNVSMYPLTLPSANYLGAWPHKENAHYTTYTTAGGWVDSATNILPLLDILFDRLDDGAGGGGGLAAPLFGGGVI